jgi:predicted DCC family thiol-disulfide oxidoreductase YuxK
MSKENFNIPSGKKVILFDGVCNLCNDSVIKVIKNDKKNVFLFAPLQSEIGEKIIKKIGVDTSKIDSIILYDPSGAYYIKSSAALRVMNEFPGLWKLTQIFRILPAAFNNIFYDFVARNRYKWFGKKDSCMIPTPELKAKFLD